MSACGQIGQDDLGRNANPFRPGTAIQAVLVFGNLVAANRDLKVVEIRRAAIGRQIGARNRRDRDCGIDQNALGGLDRGPVARRIHSLDFEDVGVAIFQCQTSYFDLVFSGVDPVLDDVDDDSALGLLHEAGVALAAECDDAIAANGKLMSLTSGDGDHLAAQDPFVAVADGQFGLDKLVFFSQLIVFVDAAGNDHALEFRQPCRRQICACV